ncbi:hypothetical protein E1A91_A03G157100v1 [Gossypium mustelinum]|uniref:non-specific serine/threonine protein kinase n=1 Tax=Gossypium mustelinum TaxID=34275 RepID=A0A5D2ZWS1_GOSMU|nr:hypothetical protein E1A91_A03G157100v1 [Gossypium mustelinum]
METYKYSLCILKVVAIKKMELPPLKEAEGEHGKHRFLVYEYMQKGNLQDHLNGISEKKIDWPSRLKVAIGAARGLAYLHSSSDGRIPIVHRDFKSTNVLLNTNFEAKISDFGLAKLMPEGQETDVTARVLGTFGYFDPEYTSTGKLTLKSDVYAFGVVLLELLTGRRAVDLNQGPNDRNLVLQVRHILNDRKKLRKVIDPEMARSSYTIESIAMFANLASRCVRVESRHRPSMSECLKELQLIFCTNAKRLGQGF